MNNKFTSEQLFKLTIEKAIKEDKHPMEVIEEVKSLIEQKRLMERQAVLMKGSVN